MDKYVGKKLDGRYEIRELIGIGGMANVYRCYDTIDDREVAIKILKDEFLNNEEFIRRFKNESKAIAVLSHPNIVKVYDVSFGDMIQYIVMEYIDGITLKEYISQQNVLSWKETVHLITQVLAALSHAHSKGVVHRDIKPQNMMLLSDGTIKVTDFGIARFSNSTRTMTEQAIGSVHYIAPEQAKGDITDGKTDIYSIGIMMYEMLTGKLPFDGENAVSVALMHLQLEPTAPRIINPSIPEGIEEITLKAMQKQPLDRYQSAQDMLQDIERFRMNPSVRFEYKYLYDKQPTKYIDAVNKGKSNRAEEYAKVVNNKDKDDDNVRHSLTIPIVAGILIAICIALAVCIPVGIFKSNRTKEAADVDVPNFVDMKYSEFLEEYEREKYQFKIETVSEYSTEYEVDVILRQEPKPGSKQIKETGNITLYINRPQGESSIPEYLVGQHQSAAEKALNNAGFYRIRVYMVDSLLDEGKVVGLYPAEGSEVSLSDYVYLYVAGKKSSNNTKPYDVDAVIGKTKEKALEYLVDYGYTKENIKFYNVSNTAKPKGEVVFTSVLGGKVDKDNLDKQEISVYISDGTPAVTVVIPVDMPQNILGSIPMKVLVDNNVQTFQDRTTGAILAPEEVTTDVLVNGTDLYVNGWSGTESIVEVWFDNNVLYRKYKVYFDTGKIDTIIGDVEYNPSGESGDIENNPDSGEDSTENTENPV